MKAKTKLIDKKNRLLQYMLHSVVAVAMAFSWSMSHVNTYIHTHNLTFKTPKASKKSNGHKAFMDTVTPPNSDVTPPPKIMIDDTQIDSSFIRAVEGSILKGYVPLAGTTHSGVTIASGFDLGQMHIGEFNNLPISPDLKAKLRPYVGLIKFKAKAYLHSHPLVITEEEFIQLNKVAANKILQPLAKFFFQSTGKSFTTLPAEAQTVIFSFAYQHGPGFMKRKGGNQELWNAFTSENWSKASQVLRSFNQYTDRRGMEADLLKTIA